MRARLIQLTTRKSGSVSSRETTLEVDTLAVGRATDNPIALGGLTVALYHAAFHLRGGRIWLETIDGDDFRVGGHVRTSQAVQAGDVVRIGAHTLTLVRPAGEEDLAVEIRRCETTGSAAEELRRRTRIGLERGWLARRPLSWAAVLVVLATFLGLPLGGAAWQRYAAETGADGSVPLAASWSSGPLSASHAHIAGDCAACHQRPFVAVADSACTDCHAGTASHAPAEIQATLFADLRCAECHAEHNGERGLARIDDGLCLDCHGNLASRHPSTALDDVSDFAGGHPQFRASVVVEPGSPARQRRSLADRPRLSERSGLRFPHDKHLAGSLRRDEGRETLTCASCHSEGARGETMAAPVFEQHCQRCHSLVFDERHPQEQAPHAPVEVVRREIGELYAALALAGRAADPAAPAAARRRPGREPSESERLGMAAWAQGRVEAVTGLLLAADGACAECHTIERDEDGRVAVAPVHVVPFAGAERWFPLARFDHDAHATVECSSCHDARSAEDSEAVLLPGIHACRSCHGGAVARTGKVTSPCVLCHDFHIDRHGGEWTASAGATGGSP